MALNQIRLRRWVGRTAAIGAAALLLATLLVLVAHTPPVRRAALRYAAALLEDRFDLALGANTLTYDLLQMRVSLAGVTLAATRARQAPFFAADLIEITFPPEALRGPLSIDRIRIENARLTVQRRADGSSNLPTPGADTSSNEPSSLSIGHIDIPRLAVAVSDESQELSLALPALALDVGRATGVVRLSEPGHLSRGGLRTEISRLDGGVAFDGRSLRLSRLALKTDEADLALGGTLDLLVDSRVNVLFSGTGDVSGLARWGTDQPAPTGTLRVDGTITGSLGAPTAVARVRSDSLSHETLTASGLSLDLAADPTRFDVPHFEASLLDGRVTGSGGVAIASGEISLSAAWTDLSLDALVRGFAPTSPLRPASRATGSATVRGIGANVRSWTIDARSRIASRPRAPGMPISGRVALHVGGGEWGLEADPSVDGATLHAALRGVLDAANIESSSLTGTVALSSPDVARLLTSLRAARVMQIAEGTIAGGRLKAEATLSGSLAMPRFEAAAEARELVGSGVSNVDVDARADGTPQRADVNAEIRQGSRNAVTVVGSVWPDAGRLEGRITGSVGEPAAIASDIPMSGTIDLQLDGGGPFGAISARGTVSVSDARYKDLRLGPLEAVVVVEPKTAHVEVTAAEFGARARADVWLGVPRLASVDLQIDDADIERLVRDVTQGAPVTGRLSLTAHGQAALDDWRQGTATIEVSAFDARAQDLLIRLEEPARVTYDRGTVDVASLDAAVGDTRLSIAGRYPVLPVAPPVTPADALRGVLVGDLAQVLSSARAVGLAELPTVSGRGPFALLARIGGSGRQPVLSADLELGPAELTPGDAPTVRELQLRARIADGWIELINASGEWQQARLVAQGRTPLRLLSPYLPEDLLAAAPAVTGPASFTARALSMTTRVLEPFLDPETLAQIEGTVDASVQVEAASLELERLRGDLRLDRLDLRVAGLPVTQGEPTHIEIDRGVARVAAWNWTGQGATVTVQGQVRLTDREAAILTAGRIDLRLLTPFIGDGVALSGVLEPRLSVSGPLDDPRLEGGVTVAGAEIRLRDPALIATDLNAVVSLSPARARVTSLSGVVNGGVLTGTGELTYGRDGTSAAQVTATVLGMGLEFPEGLRSELNADLTVAVADGAQGARGSVTGTVTVLRSAYREPLAVVTGLLSTLRAGRLVAVAARQDSLADRLSLNVRVITDGDVIVDNNLARLQLGGDLRVIGTAAAPALSGRATLREGGQLFVGRNRYTIESGTIDFANPVIIEPTMNIEARTRAGGQEIALTLKGTPETLEVGLRSVTTPELGQADVASLLLTGRRLDDVPGAEARIVGEQVLGYLSGDLLGAASRVVGLDTIRLGGVDQSTRRRDPAAIASEADPTSRLTFGRSLGDYLEITFSQSLRDGDAQTWILDYTPIPKVDLRLVSGDDSLRSYEFRHDVSVGSSPERRTSDASPRDTRDVRVTTVALTGDLGGSDGRLRRVLAMEPGDRFEFSSWQRDRDGLEQELHREGRLEARVSARRRDDGEGVALVYEIEAGPQTTIDVTGYSVSGDTTRALETAWTRSVLDDFLKEEAAAIVRRALAEDRYLRPMIAVSLATTETKALRIDIEPGERIVGRRIVIEMIDESLGGELERWVREHGFEDRAWREPDALERALVTELGTKGFVNARVTVEAPRLEGRTAVLPVAVETGPVLTIREVRFTGAHSIGDERLREAAGLAAADAYDPRKVDQAREAVARAYRGEGFTDVRVMADGAIDQDGPHVAVVFAVEEGPRQVLRDVSVRGNRAIGTDAVTRVLDVKVGEPLGADAWLRARSRLFDTALFRRVDVTPEPVDDPRPDDGERPMRLQVTVEEWPALRIRYGVQLSEEHPEGEVEGRDLTPGLSADVTRRTLFGRAITTGVVAEYQRRERLARAFINVPMLFGKPIESLLTVERSREDFADASFVTDRSGIAWEQRVRVTPAVRVSYSYRFDRDHTVDTAPALDPLDPVFDVAIDIARLTGTAVFDTRNDPIDATRGWLVSSSLEYAPATLGSAIRFVRHLGQAYHFQPFHRLVFASAARVGLATALGGQTLISSERFFSGGARSVRGVQENGLGPRDILGDAAGGRALVVLNHEVRFPVYRWLGGVGFIDAGNVFDSAANIDFDGLVSSVGTGIRVKTPFALLRADVARLWTSVPNQPAVRWTFGIGQTF